MLVDRAVIHVRGGKGGDGIVSMRREAYLPKGGPDGGDGGRGGTVTLRATEGVDTLLDMAGHHHWHAENGQPGSGKSRTGRSGEDLVVQVPAGTLVYDEDRGELLGDLDAPGKDLVVARGGTGGFGNEHFKSALDQAPRRSTPGEAGEERTLRLELKLIADVGLVGKPNAGKSTLLSRLSAARPRVADYPFTTLEPQLGIAELSGYRRLVLADIPGLIEGAHQGTGLGHEFLRHIERTRLLVHVLEPEPADGSDPVENYRVVRTELGAYSPELAAREEIVVVNKADLFVSEAEAQACGDQVAEKIGRPVQAISAVSGLGMTRLLESCWKRLHA